MYSEGVDRRAPIFVALVVAALLGAGGCGSGPAAPAQSVTYPRLMVGPEDRAAILGRLDREPWRTLYARIKAEAAGEWQTPGPEWNASLWSRHAGIAQANAMLAWLHDDPTAAAKAKAFLLGLDPDRDSNAQIDINIRVPNVLIPYVNTLDLLRAGPWLTAAEDAEAEARILTVTRQFAERFLDNPVFFGIAMQTTQNNHPIRSASALGYVGLAFPEDPDAARWLNWAVSEMAHLLSTRGAYVMADGGVSKRPFYAQFGLAAALPFLIAVDRVLPADHVFRRDCRSRIEIDPFAGHGCVEGEPFRLDNPLQGPLLRRTLEWLTALRLPNGNRA